MNRFMDMQRVIKVTLAIPGLVQDVASNIGCILILLVKGVKSPMEKLFISSGSGWKNVIS
ncbi:hypothetical protein SpiBuddy_0299 [Sphaerochaeta globosa str. Buddy]|uniref:Uncharacterized protein n=1 Tax=Sphaerochaeta globosa (strain ATCC BAA-1886 / DSM 22777 / Buddy) TaxID=158189 RepID=F0RU51_SPHGB|nr:hypothetical protein SpiBuddy_0299 [Sphaerochaeta globosa str. Buddy]